MTPGEHYAEAERLLRYSAGWAKEEPPVADVLAAAQVHATLALALEPAEPMFTATLNADKVADLKLGQRVAARLDAWRKGGGRG